MLAMTPSGSCDTRSSSLCSASVCTVASRSVSADAPRKKSMRAARPLSSFLDWRIGLPTSDVSVCASSSWRRVSSSRNARMASSRRFIGSAAQRGWAARAVSYLRRTAAWPSTAISAMSEPLAGLRMFMGIGCLERERLGLHPRVAQEIVEEGRVVDERAVAGGMELGMPLHRVHVRRAGPAYRLDQAVGLGPGLDDKAAPEVLDRLVMDRVGLDDRRVGIEPRERRACDERRRMHVLLVDRPVAMVERVRQLRGDVLDERAAERDVDELQAAAHAEHRLS